MNIQRFIDRTLSKSILHQIGLVLIFAVTALGVLIILRCLFSHTVAHKDFLNWVLHFINPASSFGEEKNIPDRYWSLIIGFIGMIFLSGLLISIFNNIVVRRIEKIQNGQVSYSFNDHYLIIGFDEMTASIIRQMYAENRGREIVVQTAKNIKDVRRQLEVALNKEEMRQVIFMHGASNSEEDLQKLHIQNAHRVIILGDSDCEAHDALTMQCWRRINISLKKRENKKMECDVLFNDQSIFALLQKIGTNTEHNSRQDQIHSRLFNFYETWAQKVIVDNKALIRDKIIEYTPLDRKEGIRYDSDKNVHFVIMGMNNMGIALAIEAARTAHFPNFIHDKSRKTHITFIDPNAEQEMNRLISRYPHLFELLDFDYTDTTQELAQCSPVEQYKNHDLEYTDFLDIRFSFIKGDFESPRVRKILSDWAQSETNILTVAVCHDDTAKSTDIGLYLPPIIFSKQIPVFIRQQETSELFTERAIGDLLGNKYKNIRPFGMVNECFSMEIREIEKIAMKVKWIYDTYTYFRHDEKLEKEQALQKTKESVIDEEKLKEAWQREKLPYRWSNIYHAYTIGVKNRSFNLLDREMTEEDLLRLANVEHNRWNVERLIFGYRATTKQENEEIRNNPFKKSEYKNNEFAHFDIRPYNKLDVDLMEMNVSEYDICLSKCLTKIIHEEI